MNHKIDPITTLCEHCGWSEEKCKQEPECPAKIQHTNMGVTFEGHPDEFTDDGKVKSDRVAEWTTVDNQSPMEPTTASWQQRIVVPVDKIPPPAE